LLVNGNALNRRFDYDPIYRLLSTAGRECDRPLDGEPWEDHPRCTDLTRARAYTERYRYDAMGNLLPLEHRNDSGGFAREFTVETANNRLRRMEIGDIEYDYTFDANGNMRLETTSRHCITVMGEQSGVDVVSMRVSEGDRIDIEGVSLGVLYTPGHTDDSYSFLLPDRVFTGDTLLIRGTAACALSRLAGLSIWPSSTPTPASIGGPLPNTKCCGTSA
jgi:hypothetical protein